MSRVTLQTTIVRENSSAKEALMRRASIVIELDAKRGVRRIAGTFNTDAEQVAITRLIEKISSEIATLSLAAKNAGRQHGGDR